jgi:hypothetical protein
MALACCVLAGCQDPPPSATRADRLSADEAPSTSYVQWAEPEASEAPDMVGDGFKAVDGFTIRDMSLSSQQIVGSERFTVRVIVSSPLGDTLKGYGLKTPYEEGVHAFASLPMAIRNGEVRIKVDPLSTMPKRGVYPIEFWLLNDRHEASNRLRGELTVQ